MIAAEPRATAVSNSFLILLQYPEIVMPAKQRAVHMLQDTALYVALPA